MLNHISNYTNPAMAPIGVLANSIGVNHAANGSSQKPIVSDEYNQMPNYYELFNRAGLGFWRFDLSDNCVELCPVLASLTGFNRHFSVFSLIRKLGLKVSRYLFLSICQSVKQAKNFEREIKLTDGKGNDRWFKLNGICEADNAGMRRLSGTVVEVSNYKKSENHIQESIAAMCHEIKTPISILRLYVQTSTKFLPDGDSFVRTQLEKADLQITRMNNLVDQYMKLSLTEQGLGNVNSTGFDLSALAQELLEDYARLNPNMCFEMNLDKNVMVCANRDQIVQVMSNMLSNAVKFSAKGKVIRIKCRTTLKGNVFSVFNFGSGISTQDQSKVFTKYFRSAHAHKHNIAGYGLGLYVSKQIIDAHMGHIFCTSEAGQNAEFGFLLPAVEKQK